MIKTWKVVHLMAGDDTWTPTNEELLTLVDTFQHAQLECKEADESACIKTAMSTVVASRKGIDARILELTGDEKVLASSKQMQLAIAARLMADLKLPRLAGACDSQEYANGYNAALHEVKWQVQRIVDEYLKDLGCTEEEEQPEGENNEAN